MTKYNELINKLTKLEVEGSAEAVAKTYFEILDAEAESSAGWNVLKQHAKKVLQKKMADTKEIQAKGWYAKWSTPKAKMVLDEEGWEKAVASDFSIQLAIQLMTAYTSAVNAFKRQFMTTRPGESKFIVSRKSGKQ